MRWQHPERGLVMPSQFVPLAEESALSIGQRVLEEACQQAKKWQELYPAGPPLIIGVSLSARQLRHPDLVGDVEGSLRESAVVGDE